MKFRILGFVFLFSIFIIWILGTVIIFYLYNNGYDYLAPNIRQILDLFYILSIVFLMPIGLYLIIITKNKKGIIDNNIFKDLFWGDGRLSRGKYILISIFASFTNSLIDNFDSIEKFKIYIKFLLYYFIIIFTIKRLHDFNKSGIYILPYIFLVILFIFSLGLFKNILTIIIIILSFSLFFIPGNNGANKFGEK